MGTRPARRVRVETVSHPRDSSGRRGEFVTIAENPDFPPEPPAAVKDILLANYKEHADEARQHENQRERMTALVIAVGGGSLALATSKVEGVNLTLLGVALVVLGLYGAVFSLKHYERNRRHVAVMRGIGRRLEELYPLANLQGVRAEVNAAHREGFGWVERVRVHHLWIGLPLMVSLLGVALLLCK